MSDTELYGMESGLGGAFKDYVNDCSTDDIEVWENFIANTEHTHRGTTSCTNRCGAKNVPFVFKGKLDKLGQVDPPAFCPDCRKTLGMAPLDEELQAIWEAGEH